MDEQKKWYSSKTLWTNLIVFVGAMLFEFNIIGSPLGTETVATIMLVLNFILRFITKTEIVWMLFLMVLYLGTIPHWYV